MFNQKNQTTNPDNQSRTKEVNKQIISDNKIWCNKHE